MVRTLQKSAKITKSRQRSLTPLVLRLGAIVLTNLLCWLTMCIMAIMSLSGYPLVASAESLVSLVIFPLNSIINPTINTFCTTQFLLSYNCLAGREKKANMERRKGISKSQHGNRSMRRKNEGVVTVNG
jgi:hypothetical protein